MIGRPRAAFALLAALISVVLLGALIVGAVIATTEETRTSASSALGARALAAAESAVERAIVGWVQAQAESLAIGQRASQEAPVGDVPVTMTLIRLDSSVFWVVGEALAGGEPGEPGPSVRRRIGILVRRATDSAGRVTIFRFEERPWVELF